MNFNKHSAIKGAHAFLGASTSNWLNYTDEKMAERYFKHLATIRGTKLHELAAKLIECKQDLPPKQETLCMYVNDAIKYDMTPEQLLYYSSNCFGTADAIAYRDGLLRIHDLKTGTTPTHMEQLMIYAALFCLEYDVSPNDIDFELRIYQNNKVRIDNPTIEHIAPICDKIIHFDDLINQIKFEEEYR